MGLAEPRCFSGTYRALIAAKCGVLTKTQALRR